MSDVLTKQPPAEEFSNLIKSAVSLFRCIIEVLSLMDCRILLGICFMVYHMALHQHSLFAHYMFDQTHQTANHKSSLVNGLLL